MHYLVCKMKNTSLFLMKFFDFNQLIRMALTCNKYIHLKGLKSSGGYQLKKLSTKVSLTKYQGFESFEIITLHIEICIFILPGIILKIVSFHDFSPQSCLCRLLPAGSAQAAFWGKSWKETIFKIMAWRINVIICNSGIIYWI